MPRSLTVDQKQQRVDASEECLGIFKRNKAEFFRRYITMDEVWIHHYTPESKRQSSEWTAAGESRPKRPKTQQWAGKVMASVFWDGKGIIYIDYLEKGKTINSEYYIALLERLKTEVAKKTAAHGVQKDPVPPRQCAVPQVTENDGEIVRIRLRTAVTPTIFSRFGPPATIGCLHNLKKLLAGKKFHSNNEVITECETYFEGPDKSFYIKGIEMLERRWIDCISLRGNYVDE